MLMASGIFEKEVAFTLLEIEISQSANRILLGCLASGNNEVKPHPHPRPHPLTTPTPLQYYVTASLRLEHMLKCPFLTMKDIFFIFSNLARIAQLALEDGDSEWLQYVAAILRCLFSLNMQRLKLDQHLQSLPDPRTPDFGTKFGQYCNTSEWKQYMQGTVSSHVTWMWSCDIRVRSHDAYPSLRLQLKTADVQYSDVLMRWLLELEERKKECSKAAIMEDEQRRRTIVDNEMRYQVSGRGSGCGCGGDVTSLLQKVLLVINDLLAEEKKRQQSVDSQQRNELAVTLQKWRSTRRFFTGERGAWSSRQV